MQVVAKAVPEPPGAFRGGTRAPHSPPVATAVKKRFGMMRVIVSSHAPPPPPPPPPNPGGDDPDPSRKDDEGSSSSDYPEESDDDGCANLQMPKKPRRPKSAYRFFFLRERRRILREFAEDRERRRGQHEDEGAESHEEDGGELTTGQHSAVIVRPPHGHGRPSNKRTRQRFGFGEIPDSAFGHVVSSNPDSDILREGEDSSSKTGENLNDGGPCCQPDDEDEVVRIIGERWKAVASQDPHRLARCQKMAEREMDRYKVALKEYSEAVACISKQDPQVARKLVVAGNLPCNKSIPKRPNKTIENSGVSPEVPVDWRRGLRLIDGCPTPRRVVNVSPPPASLAGPGVIGRGPPSSLTRCPPVLRHLPGASSRFGNGARTPSSLLRFGLSPLPLPPGRSPHAPRRAMPAPPIRIPTRPRMENEGGAADVSLLRIPGLSSTSQAA